MSADDDDRKELPRRRFLDLAVGTSAAGLAIAGAYPVVRYLEPPPGGPGTAVRVGELERFPVGTVRTVMVHDRPVFVIRTADEVRAFSALCTHLQCVVAYDPERGQFVCPCHGGVYSIDGRNLEGPPPRPLDELAVTIDEGFVLVSPSA
jgi:cytochrome b6-f complex iron-sulfur subunit